MKRKIATEINEIKLTLPRFVNHFKNRTSYNILGTIIAPVNCSLRTELFPFPVESDDFRFPYNSDKCVKYIDVFNCRR